MSGTKACLTPGARWTFSIHPGKISIEVSFESLRADWAGTGFTRNEAIKLENELHDAIEPILASRWADEISELRSLKQVKK